MEPHENQVKSSTPEGAGRRAGDAENGATPEPRSCRAKGHWYLHKQRANARGKLVRVTGIQPAAFEERFTFEGEELRLPVPGAQLMKKTETERS